ncbi:C40 family peptidase [Arthrobacter sp. StoSoilB13]|uniref:C40 family peptidase n=1 Tax=Arthrobacter sp. StoSoilB13 TaxID=2830993 RepID=UPI001CC41171|nr:C40 family peptidase [Arthrobacter sp. StoSoilB13]
MPNPGLAAVLVRRRTLYRLVGAFVAVVALAFAVVASAVAVVLVGDRPTAAVACVSGADADVGNALEVLSRPPGVEFAGLSAAQVNVAKGYVSVGKGLRLPREALVIAIMMSLQESSLRMLANINVPDSFNYPHDGVGSDHDSVGSAQQRPAAGWGSVQELMDITYNARAFYGGTSGPNHGSPRGLLDVPGWASLSKGQAAQAVQVSAFPELYDRWEPQASAIVDALSGTAPAPSCKVAPAVISDSVSADGLSQIRQDILRFTKMGVGGSYVWGGTAFKEWDCSGFVQWVYRQVGIDLPRVEQWRVGQMTDNPQIGDLVVQNPQGPNNWGHVGIYAGDGLMYSALNPSVGTLMHPIDWNHGTAYFDLLA